MKLTRKAKIGLVVAFLLTAAGITWLVIGTRHEQINSYTECRKSKGSVILESYPSVCVTTDKRRFVNPDEQTPANPTSLAIREFGAVIPLTGDIGDAYYTYDRSKDQIFITTAQLEHQRSLIRGCSAGLHGLYYKKTDRRLEEQHQVELLCAPLGNDATKRIEQIQKELRDAAAAAQFE